MYCLVGEVCPARNILSCASDSHRADFVIHNPTLSTLSFVSGCIRCPDRAVSGWMVPD